MKLVPLSLSEMCLTIAGGDAYADQNSDYSKFVNCIEHTTQATCPLPYHSTPYLVSTTINVTRALTVQGQSNGAPDATLMRPSSGTWVLTGGNEVGTTASPTTLVAVSGAVAGSVVTFQNLVFDGNRANNGIPLFPTSNSVDEVNGRHVEDYAGGYAELRINYNGVQCWRCVIINNVTFQNSLGYGLQISNSGVEVLYSTFHDAFLSGIVTYRNTGSLPLLYSGVYRNTFIDSGGAAVAFNDGGDGTQAGQNNPNHGPNVNMNTFFSNGREFADRWDCSGGPCGSGEIMISNTTSGATLYDNTFNGNNVNGSAVLPAHSDLLATSGIESSMGQDTISFRIHPQ